MHKFKCLDFIQFQDLNETFYYSLFESSREKKQR